MVYLSLSVARRFKVDLKAEFCTIVVILFIYIVKMYDLFFSSL